MEATMAVFLKRPNLTKQMKRLVRASDVRMALAYWGKDALTLLDLSPKRAGLQIVCCLKGGKSDPDIIEQFGKKALQNDRLHAKVIWTPEEAIVGSANASSNGMPSEEEQARGLIEAGVLVDDDESLNAIKLWFDKLKDRSKEVNDTDLAAARAARAVRPPPPWDAPPRKQSFLEALRDGGSLEFAKQRIAFLFYREDISDEERRREESDRKRNAEIIKERLHLYVSDKEFDKRVEYYTDWDGLPPDTYLIELEYKDKPRYTGVFRTFHDTKPYVARDKKGQTEITYVLTQKYNKFPYKITRRDEAVINAAGPELWKLAEGSDNIGRVLELRRAAPILLKHARGSSRPGNAARNSNTRSR
jgi:hypothetical protein